MIFIFHVDVTVYELMKKDMKTLPGTSGPFLRLFAKKKIIVFFELPFSYDRHNNPVFRRIENKRANPGTTENQFPEFSM